MWDFKCRAEDRVSERDNTRAAGTPSISHASLTEVKIEVVTVVKAEDGLIEPLHSNSITQPDGSCYHA